MRGAVVSVFFINERMFFPGYVALLPVASAASIILFERFVGESPWNFLTSVLSRETVVRIGKMSYSLYLWHWPVYAFVDYSICFLGVFERSAMKIVLTLLFAYASYTWLEVPARRTLARPANWRVAYAVFVLFSAGIGWWGLHLWRTEYLDSSIAISREGGVVVNQAIGLPVVALYGDSLASMNGKSLAKLANKHNFEFHVLSVAGKDPFPTSALYRAAMPWLEKSKPDCIIVAASWLGQQHQPDRIKQLIEELQCHTLRLILLTEAPMLQKNQYRDSFRTNGYSRIQEPDDLRERRLRINSALLEFSSEKVVVVDIAPLFVDEDGYVRYFDASVRQNFHDYIHLSEFGVEKTLPILGPVIERAIQRNRRD